MSTPPDGPADAERGPGSGRADHPDQHEHPVLITIGRAEYALRKRYEVLSILNDLLIAAWFVAGSILFFFEDTISLGTWFFLIGSAQLMLRPAIRLARRVHLRRLHPGLWHETSRDF